MFIIDGEKTNIVKKDDSMNSNLLFSIVIPVYMAESFLEKCINIIAETFYNFGWLGVIFGFGVGIIIGKLSNYFDKYLVSNRYDKLAYVIMPLFACLWWIRDSFSGLTRRFVWTSIIIFLLNKFYKYLRHTRNRKSYANGYKE